MPVVAWIALAAAAWTACGLLAVAIACAARRGDAVANDLIAGATVGPVPAPRRRMEIEVTPVHRPWARPAAAAPVVLADVAVPQA
jgi:N-acetylglucosamine kinase-like BadF-type ATPase